VEGVTVGQFPSRGDEKEVRSQFLLWNGYLSVSVRNENENIAKHFR
jgi:hypothetical protein